MTQSRDFTHKQAIHRILESTSRSAALLFTGTLLLSGVLSLTVYMLAKFSSDPTPKMLLIITKRAYSYYLFPAVLLYPLSFFIPRPSRSSAQLTALSFAIIYLISDKYFFCQLALEMGYKNYLNSSGYYYYTFDQYPWIFNYCVLSRAAAVIAAIFTFISIIKNKDLGTVDRSKTASDHKAFSFSAYCLCHLATVISILCLGTFSSLRFQIEASTNSHLVVHSDGLYSVIETLKKDKTEIILFPTMHVGEADFYNSFLARYDYRQGVALLEGIKGLDCNDGVSYRGLASSLGISYQADTLLKYCNARPTDEWSTEFKCQGQLEYVVADLDARKFDSETLRYIKILAEEYGKEGAGSIPQIEARIRKRFSGNSFSYLAVNNDLFEKRESNLLKQVAFYEQKNPLILIPWGAAHAQSIKKNLLNNGYKTISSEEQKLMGMYTLIVARLPNLM